MYSKILGFSPMVIYLVEIEAADFLNCDVRSKKYRILNIDLNFNFYI